MYKRLLQIYIISLPFVSAFALSGTVTISLLLSVIMFILAVRGILIERPCFSFPINYIIFISFLFWVTVVLSYSFNSFGFPKSTNHLLAYSTFIFLFLLTPTLYLFVFKNFLEHRFILKTIFQTVLFCTLFTVLEFIIKNVFG